MIAGHFGNSKQGGFCLRGFSVECGFPGSLAKALYLTLAAIGPRLDCVLE